MTATHILPRRPSLRGGVLLFLTFLPLLLWGQPRRDEESLYEPVPPFRCEAWTAPSADPALGRLDIHLWIRPSLLIFVRNASDSAATPFVATAEISIEVLDSARTLRFRRYFRRVIPSTVSDPAAMPDTALTVSAAAWLPPGSYVVNAELSDTESRRRVTRSVNVAVRTPRPDSLVASSVFWCDPDSARQPGSGQLFYGGTLPLGRPALGYVACAGLADPGSASVVVRLYRAHSTDAGGRDLMFADTLHPPKFVTEGPFPDTVNGGRYLAGDRAAPAFLVPLRADTLGQGAYSVEVSITESHRRTSVAQPFQVAWPRMPRSLMSLGSALRPMEYLMTKEEFSALKDLKSAAQREAFERFWRGKNPNPGSAMNEVMGEFYRRVDAAAQEFGTMRQPDGARSDRGKVYILYGPPTTRERVLGTSSVPREVWYYASTRKSVLFVDEKRTGDYTLTTEQ